MTATFGSLEPKPENEAFEANLNGPPFGDLPKVVLMKKASGEPAKVTISKSCSQPHWRVQRVSAKPDVFDVTITHAGSGTFDITYDGVTHTLPWNATALDVEDAILHGVDVVAGTSPVTYVITSPDNAVHTVSIDGSALGGDAPCVFTVTLTAKGGTFILDYDGTTTSAIWWDASASDVQTAIGGGVTVTGSSPTWTVTCSDNDPHTLSGSSDNLQGTQNYRFQWAGGGDGTCVEVPNGTPTCSDGSIVWATKWIKAQVFDSEADCEA
jgi:hypothetical protein